MAARKKSATRKQTPSRKSPASKKKSAAKRASPDAIALLRADHRTVQALFETYEKTRSADRKSALCAQICKALKVHTQIEEEIFYPAARGAIRDDDLLDEATVEHQSAKELIAQIESGKPGDKLYDAKVQVLGEYIRHHVKEEQNEMFPKVQQDQDST